MAIYSVAFKEDVDVAIEFLASRYHDEREQVKQARDFLDVLEAVHERVALFPRMYAISAYPRWHVRGYRVASVGSYRAIYVVRNDEVHFLRLLHRAQDPGSMVIHDENREHP